MRREYLREARRLLPRSVRIRRSLLVALGIIAAAAAAAMAFIQDEEVSGWPREITVPEGTIVIYQPQPETFEGDKIKARTAISVTPTGQTEPVFGTVWLDARIETDRDNRTADVTEVKVLRVGFPNATDEQKAGLTRILEEKIPSWDLEISLDRLLTSLELSESRRLAAEGLKTDPPIVKISYEPAVLIVIDGEPRLQKVEGTDLMRILNTPFTILFDQGARRYYLYAGEEQWYGAPDWKGPWEVTSSVPSHVAALAPPEEEEAEEEPPAEGEDEEAEEDVGPPAIVVSTEPTELIVIEGQPEYTPITEADLMYVSNTESDIVMDMGSARYFVVLSGRWFTAESLEGPWSYAPADKLPAGFAKIPDDSEMGHLLASVPGTEQAADAVMDNQIPQTSTVSRTEAKLEVEYDGDPKFEPIEETDGLELAINTPNQVIKVKDKYYAVEEAVWFVADAPTGPWAVADEVPSEIYEIPPSSSAYNTTYVYVYDSTPQVVYVGYYPGYTNSYVYGGTVVYGTGWVYPAWYGTYYYPRPATFGFSVRWNPWYGWSFGFGWSVGPFRFGIGFGGWYRGGWWGPGRYRGYRRGYHRGWHRGARAGYRAGYRAGSNAARRNNIYNRRDNVSRNVPRTQDRARSTQQPRQATNRQNNVFSDRDGNVQRRTDQGWQERTRDGGWGEAQRQQPAQRQRTTPQRSTSQSLERSHQSRQRGTTRTNNYRSQRSSAGRSRGGGRRR